MHNTGMHGSFFNFLQPVLSVMAVVSVVFKFSFDLYMQTAVFLVLLTTSLFLLNSYRIKINFYYLPLLCLFAVMLISYCGADCKINVRDQIFIFSSAVFAGFNISFLSAGQKKKLFMVLISVALWLSFMIFLIFFSGSEKIYKDMALSANVIAGFLVLVYPLFYIYIKETKFTKTFIITAAFIFAAVFLTKSRAAVFAALIPTVLFLYEYRKKKYIKIFILSVVVLCTAGLIYLFALKYDSGSLSERFIWWHTAYLIFKENIFFGCGPGNFAILFKVFRPEYVLNTLYAHNIVMQLLSDVGIFGFTAFISLMFCFYAKIKDNIKKQKEKYFNIAVFFSITSFLITNIFDYGFFVPANMLVFFLISCSVFYAEPVKLKKRRINRAVPICIVLFFSFITIQPVTAQIYYKKGIDFYKQKQYKMAIEEFDRALKYDKKNPEYYVQAARAYLALYTENGCTDNVYADNAARYNKKAMDLYRNDAVLKTFMADICLSTGQKKEALRLLQEALKYDKYNPYLKERYLEVKRISAEEEPGD